MSFYEIPKYIWKIAATISIFSAVALILLEFVQPPVPASAATPGTMSYQYDSLGRLVTDANSSGNSGTYDYDAAGNRISAQRN